MNNETDVTKDTRRRALLFSIGACLLIWLLAVPVLVALTFLGQGVLLYVLYALAAWSPTIALFILFKKLCPGNTIKRFYRTAFQTHLNIPLIICVSSLQLLVLAATVGIMAIIRDVTFGSLLILGPQALLMCFITAITQGATGEESGWRGFLQPLLEKSHGVIKASVIVGIIWWFWHMPVMLFNSGLSGWAWVQHITLFLVFCIAMSNIMAICYNHCKNLFIPIWIHFLFNFTIPMVANNGDSEIIFTYIYTAFYTLTAIGYSIWHTKTVRKAV